MYLSRMILNPRSRQVRSEIANPYEMHRTIMRAFPDADQGGAGRVLFRLDTGRDGIPVMIVQSELPPDWTFLNHVEGYLMEMDENQNPDSKLFNISTINPDRNYMFRLRANPTVKRDGKRHALLREQDQESWLRRKAAVGGFVPLGFRIIPEQPARGRKRDGILKLHSVLFEGILRVDDIESFRATVASGLGSGKGFGFGLLSLAPARQ